MARSSRNTKLESRTGRMGLAANKRHWQTVGKSLALGYRRGKNGGTWYVRLAQPNNQYRIEAIGIADDHRDADGESVLDYFQAQDKARIKANQRVKSPGRYYVKDAISDYLAWAMLNSKDPSRAEKAANRHILPLLGDRRVVDLNTAELRAWHHGRATVKRPGDKGPLSPDKARGRKATANRLLTILKAALNRAYYEEKVPSDEAWRKVKPFPNVDAPRIRFLSAQSARTLVNACDPDFRPLVQAALLTGCRYGELTRLEVGDYNTDAGVIHLRHTKNGKPRFVPLNDEGKILFDRLAAGRTQGDIMFRHADGTAWGHSHQIRRMVDACQRANIQPRVTFHDLRNTYGALLAMQGVSMKVIAELLGHSDTRITEKHYAHLQDSYVAETLRKHLPNFGVERDNVTAIGR